MTSYFDKVCAAFILCGVAASLSACESRFPVATLRPEPAVTSVETSWMGNTFGGADQKWMSRTVSALHATSNGTLFVVGQSAENESLIIRDGRITGRLTGGNSGGRTLGRVVAGSDTHLFVAFTQQRPAEAAPGADWPVKDASWGVLRRYDTEGRAAPFPGGRGADGTLLLVGTTAEDITGAAVGTNVLVVSHRAQGGQVTTFALSDLSTVGDFLLPDAGPLVVASDNSMWIVAGDGSIGHYSAKGETLAAKIAAQPDAPPIALALDPDERLMVARGGVAQQVVVYSGLGNSPEPTKTLGVLGGITASGGKDVRPESFSGISSLSVDGSGVAFVGMNLAGNRGGRVVAIGASVVWSLESSVGFDGACPDPKSGGRDVYTGLARFRMDFNEIPGRQARMTGWTFDRARFPDDPRTADFDSALPRIFYSQGAKFMALVQSPAAVAIYRFEAGTETAIPVARMGTGNAPALDSQNSARRAAAWLWHDANGDGRPTNDEYAVFANVTGWGAWVDDAGTIWRAGETSGIDRLTMDGVDSRGVPIYRAAALKHDKMPEPFERLARIAVDVNGSVYIGGFTHERPNPWGAAAWTSLGTELIRYDDWDAKRTLRWRAPLLLAPDLGHGPRGFAVAADRVFMNSANDDTLRVFDARDGRDLGRLRPGPQIARFLAAERSSMPLTAFERSNGEINLYAADGVHSKITLFRVPPGWQER